MDRADEVVTLNDGLGRVEVLPAWGAGIRHYDVCHAGDWIPIFRPDMNRRGMFALGCNVLLPFSNRISGGGFWHAGVFHELTANIDGNKMPTHGDAFQRAWAVEADSNSSVTLSLTSSGPGPFRYAARLAYTLRQGRLSLALSATNSGPTALPFGAGFHPWFVRNPSTLLRFQADGYWTEDDAHLPDVFVPVGKGAYEFATTGRLPKGWINSAFTGWNGTARIEWPDRSFGVEIDAKAPLTCAVVFSPSIDADYFCFEPVSHSVDAHNRSDVGSSLPQVLSPGEALSVEMTISPLQQGEF